MPDTAAAAFRIAEIALYERPVELRLPFRFGVVTLTRCPQAFARVRIEWPDGSSAWGAAAEMMAPKWFDKNLDLSNEDNFDQLRRVTADGARRLPERCNRCNRVRPLRATPRRARPSRGHAAASTRCSAAMGPR